MRESRQNGLRESGDKIPRLAPTSVEEKRITLGNWERVQIKQIVDPLADTLIEVNKGAQTARIIASSGAVIAGVGVCAIGYSLYQVSAALADTWESITSAPEKLSNWAQDKKENVTGSKIPISHQFGIWLSKFV